MWTTSNGCSRRRVLHIDIGSRVDTNETPHSTHPNSTTHSLTASTQDNQKNKTYNSEDSLVVTHPTTNSPACGLSTAERTGSPVFHTLWSYVRCYLWKRVIECKEFSVETRASGDGTREFANSKVILMH